MSRLLLTAFLLALAAPPARGAAPPAPAASARAYSSYLRGRLAEQEGNWSAALGFYRDAVEADPRAPALRVALAEAHARSGEIPGAEAEARKAIALDPAGPAAAEAWLILGKTATVSRRSADAQRALRSAIEVQSALAARRPTGQGPIDPDPWRILAQLRLDAGDDAGAEALLDDLSRRLPSDGAAALRDLGRIHAERRELDRAAALYRKAVAVERRDVDAWRRLAELEESRRRFDEARLAWEGLVRQDPDDPDALVGLGRLSLRPGNVDAARAFFDQALHVGSDDVEARTRIAFAWLDARRPAQAIGVVDEGLRRSADGRLLYVRGLALRDERRWEEAAAAFGAVATGDTDLDVAAIAGRASVLERWGRAGEAVAVLQQELARRPRNERLLFALGVAQERAGDHAGAIATMRRLLVEAPGNAEAMNFVGYTLAERGEKLDEAEVLVGRALQIEPDNGSFLDSLGWIQFQRGEVAAAVATLERADVLAGPEPTILEHLGEAYRRARRDDDAARAFRRALQALDEGAEPDQPGQRAGIEKKLRELPGGEVRPDRR
ncbi:MAG: tetratricopeptide repeat protein [Deltaproteobacteria bacterium]